MKIKIKTIGLKIKANELRGVKSYGMICSLEELGLHTLDFHVLGVYEASKFRRK